MKLTTKSIRGSERRRGAAMLYAIFAVFAAATMVSMMMSLTLSSQKSSTVKTHGGRARYLAEGAIEAAKVDVATAVANFEQVPLNGTATIGGVQVPYTVTPTGFQSISTDASGIQTLLNGYEIRATAAVEGHRSTAHRLMNTEATPVFQFAVFYTDDLEINPGPSMTLGGRVHSNADMYLNCGGTLTVNTNYLRAVGGIYRHRKDDPSRSDGLVNVRKWVEDPYDPLEPSNFKAMLSQSALNAAGVPSTSGYDANFLAGYDANGDGDFYDAGDFLPWGPGALAYWAQAPTYTGGTGNTIMDGSHGITQAAVPHIGSIQMFEPHTGGDWYYDAALSEYVPAAPGAGTHVKGYYHGEADLSIITYPDYSFAIFDKDGNDITASLPGVARKRKLYDARQANGGAAKMRLTEVDLAALQAAGAYPANGLIYAAHYDAGVGMRAKGIVLTNGSELDAPLTVVSENSVYIHGDYNTVNKKGAAVIADAVNLLSNAWDYSKTQGNLPTASDTTYNVALITGNTETVGSDYNGGLENLPRFHENWSGRSCNILGSFVNTWASQYASELWAYGGDRYTAPARNWFYDTAFNAVGNLPPYTPMAVTTSDVAAW